jgi:transcriptional regulator with XRE-family HTH domain
MGTKTDRLEAIRLDLGLSKTQMAEAMGISSHYYHGILRENTSNNLRLEHLESLLATKYVNPIWLMTGEGERFLKQPDKAVQEWAAGDIIPGEHPNKPVDTGLVDYLVVSVMKEIGLPLLASDLAYGILIDFGKQYISRNPNATRQTLDVPVLTASFLALLQTAQHLIQLGFEQAPGQDTITIRFAGQTYNFVRHPPPEK